MSKLLDWVGFWINASCSLFNLSMYAAWHHWYSLPCAAFSAFVAIAMMPKAEGCK